MKLTPNKCTALTLVGALLEVSRLTLREANLNRFDPRRPLYLWRLRRAREAFRRLGARPASKFAREHLEAWEAARPGTLLCGEQAPPVPESLRRDLCEKP